MKKGYACFLVIVLVLTVTLTGVLGTKILQKEEKTSPVNINSSSEKKTNNKDQVSAVPKTDDIYYAATVTAPIKITNIQNDDKQIEYDYKIQINEVVGVIKYSVGDREDYMVFDATGTATFTLKSNETITIYDIPIDVAYQVEQLEDSNYTTTINSEKTNKYRGVITFDNNVTFNNASNVVLENPDTNDTLGYSLIVLLTISVVLLVLKNIKVKRFA